MLVLRVAAVVILTALAAEAAPGDARVISGVMEWPQRLADERFLVIRTAAGTLYVDVAGAERRLARPLVAGDRVSLNAVEGQQPHEWRATVLVATDVQAPAAAAAPAPAPAEAPAPAASPVTSAPSAPVLRLDGRVEAVGGSEFVLRSADGRAFAVDISRIGPSTLLREGTPVTVFGTHEGGERFIASGLVGRER